MLIIFRIAFTILSAILLASIIPIGTFFGWDYAVFCGVGAFIFFALMYLCKQAQEKQESVQTEEPKPNDDTQQ